MSRTVRRLLAVLSAIVLIYVGSSGQVAAAANQSEEETGSAASHQSRQDPDAIVKRAAIRLGGVGRIRGLRTITSAATGTRWTLDEGFTPGEGAAIPGPYEVDTTYDVRGDRFRLDYDVVSFGFVERQITELVDAQAGYLVGQDNNFAPPGAAAMLTDRMVSTKLHQLLMNPQLLITAILNNQLTATYFDTVELGGTRHDVLEIEHNGAPLHLFIKRGSGQISRIATLENDPLRRDVPLVVDYSRWRRFSRHYRVPTRISVYYDGELVQQERRASVEINRRVDDSLFTPPSGVVPSPFDPFLARRGVVSHQHLQSFAALGFPRDGVQLTVQATELKPGVHWLTGGSHHSLLVEHDDGLVLVDAPLDEYRSQALLDFIAANFPGRPITHIAQSHHHADHSAGARTIVAAGATLAVHESAAEFWAHVLAAPSTLVPDALATNPVATSVVTVPDGGVLVLGTGDNAVEMHSFAQPHAADLVLVVAGGVAFIVDLVNPNPAVPLPPEAQPILDLIAERNLDVEILAGGHFGFVTLDPAGSS